VNKEQASSLIRTVVQMTCAGLITRGIMTDSDVSTIAGAAEIVIPLVVSGVVTWYGSIVKRSRSNLVKAALEVSKKETGVAELRSN
jgi:hypothetical protein